MAANRVERFHRCRLVLSTFYLENRRVLRSLAFGGAGQSLHEIGHAFGKNHSSVRCLVSHHGGFVPAVANPRKTRIRLVEALFDSSIPSLACMDFTEEHAS